MIGEPTPNGETSASARTGSHAPGGDVEYTFKTAKALRARESATRTKWENQGWEFVGQTQGTLRTELQFRKPKPKGIGAFLTQAFSGLRNLDSNRQKALLGLLGTGLSLLLVGGIAGALAGDEDAPAAPAATGAEAPEATTATPTPTQEPSSEPTPSQTPEAEPDVYEGPKYKIVVVDDDQTSANLRQYWVHTAPTFDFSNQSYKEEVRLIIADIAQEQGSADFIAEVVTNREIAEAESPSLFQDFIEEHGSDYAINTIPKLEVVGWVASYTGGYDRDRGKPSDKGSAYEVIWRPYAAAEIEKWKP